MEEGVFVLWTCLIDDEVDVSRWVSVFIVRSGPTGADWLGCFDDLDVDSCAKWLEVGDDQ